jgi:hypothetical protein
MGESLEGCFGDRMKILCNSVNIELRYDEVPRAEKPLLVESVSLEDAKFYSHAFGSCCCTMAIA